MMGLLYKIGSRTNWPVKNIFDNIESALAIVDIYNQNYEEDWTLEHYGQILRNAADWVEYYNISRAIWARVFENMKPDASESTCFGIRVYVLFWLILKNWSLFIYLFSGSRSIFRRKFPKSLCCPDTHRWIFRKEWVRYRCACRKNTSRFRPTNRCRWFWSTHDGKHPM